MDRERAETHLRQLAEAELRRATAPGGRGLAHSGRLSLVAQALIAPAHPGCRRGARGGRAGAMAGGAGRRNDG